MPPSYKTDPKELADLLSEWQRHFEKRQHYKVSDVARKPNSLNSAVLSQLMPQDPRIELGILTLR